MLDEKIKWLFERCKASVSISFNTHKDYYESVEKYLEDDIHQKEIAPEILKEMISRDTIIRVQAYPDTPVGFYSAVDYDLDRALDRIINAIKTRD